MSLKTWWQRVTKEEYELILTVPKDTLVHADGTRTESTKQVKYKAKKLVKVTPKHIIFKDLDDNRNELKFLKPIEYHIKKIR